MLKSSPFTTAFQRLLEANFISYAGLKKSYSHLMSSWTGLEKVVPSAFVATQ